MLPLAAPGIATAGILSMLLAWNEFLFALTLTRSQVKTAPVGISEFTGMFGTSGAASAPPRRPSSPRSCSWPSSCADT